jgi:hypothetical protein
MINFLIDYRHLISNKKLGFVVQVVSSHHDNELLSLLVKHVDSFDSKSKEVILSELKHVDMPPLEYANDILYSLVSLIQHFPFAQRKRNFERVLEDVVVMYERALNKREIDADEFLGLTLAPLGERWWVKSRSNHEVFNMIVKWFNNRPEAPSFL